MQHTNWPQTGCFVSAARLGESQFLDRGLNPHPWPWNREVPTIGPPGNYPRPHKLFFSFSPVFTSECLSHLDPTNIKSVLLFEPASDLLRRRRWHPTPVLLPGKSHGRRSLVGCSSRGLEESDTTERLHFHFSLSCIGEGNGNPLQCSCLENPRERGAWWAAVYGVAQSWTRLKQLSSSSSIQTYSIKVLMMLVGYRQTA